MGGNQPSLGVAGYRDEVEHLIEVGAPFGEVEQVIEKGAGLTEEAKAALWLLAFALRDRAEQLRDARAYIAALA